MRAIPSCPDRPDAEQHDDPDPFDDMPEPGEITDDAARAALRALLGNDAAGLAQELLEDLDGSPPPRPSGAKKTLPSLLPPEFTEDPVVAEEAEPTPADTAPAAASEVSTSKLSTCQVLTPVGVVPETGTPPSADTLSRFTPDADGAKRTASLPPSRFRSTTRPRLR